MNIVRAAEANALEREVHVDLERVDLNRSLQDAGLHLGPNEGDPIEADYDPEAGNDPEDPDDYMLVRGMRIPMHVAKKRKIIYILNEIQTI